MDLYKLHSSPKSLDHYDTAFDLVPALVWERYRNNPAELKKREAVLAKDAKCAYWYARYVLNGPFKAGEAAIAKDTEYAYWYARHVLHGRFKAGEAAIAKDPEFSYMYAHHRKEQK